MILKGLDKNKLEREQEKQLPAEENAELKAQLTELKVIVKQLAQERK